MRAPQRKRKAIARTGYLRRTRLWVAPVSGEMMSLNGSGEPPGSGEDILAARASKMIAERGRGAIQHMVDKIQRAILFEDDAAAEEHARLLRIIERQFYSR